MAVTMWRVLRAISRACAPITTVIGFTFLLTFIFILYQPTFGPGLAQRLSWQAWDSISMPINAGDVTTPEGSRPNNTHEDVEVPEGVDWWNVSTSATDNSDPTSLPLDVWAPLLPHDTGLSEITVSKCMMDPNMGEEYCLPDSTDAQDAINGNWVRVARDLNLEGSIFSGWLNVYYRRTRRQDVNLITDLRLLAKGEQPDPIEGWKKAETSLRAGMTGSAPLYLWYHVGKTAAQMSAEEKANLITEIDVIYGDDAPWYGFERLEPATMLAHNQVISTWLTYRRGVKIPPRAPPLHFSHEGKFKILQVADLHFSVSQGFCRDTILDPCDAADNITTSLLGRVMDKEKPDLIVFTGDQLNGQETSWDPKSVLAKFARAVTDRGIPWAAVFGNHDEEDGLAKSEQIQLMRGLPYSLVERGPRDIHGEGNYVLKVKSADASMTHLLTLYFIDSGSYSKGFFDWWGFFTPTAYDFIHGNQIDWFLQESALINPIERPFRPDTGRDLGSLWDGDPSKEKRQTDQLTPPTSKLAKPNAMMFFHIPLPETYGTADENPRTGKPLDVGNSDLEKPGNAKENGGMFQNGLMKAEETDHVGRHAPEVKVVANGHCHITDNCRRIQGIWMCFGGGGSYAAYGKVGFDRRFRIYDVSEYGETIKTYKRTENDEIIDEQVLTGRGAAPLE